MVSVSDSVIVRSRVQLPVIPLSDNNSGQAVHTPRPVSAMLLFGGPAECWLNNQIKSDQIRQQIETDKRHVVALNVTGAGTVG